MKTLKSNGWRERAHDVSRCIKGISHEIRLGILLCLRSGEKNVSAIASELGCAQPTVSQHLAMMRDRGILQSKRVGNQTLYKASDARIYKMLDLIQELFCSPSGSRL